MPSRTQIFSLIPWKGGINSSSNEAKIPPNQLITGKNIVIGDEEDTRKKREGIDFDFDDASNSSLGYIGGIDFHYDNPSGIGKVQRIFTVDESGNFFVTQTDGTRTAVTDSGTVYSSAITNTSLCVFNNAVIICVDGADNVVKTYKPADQSYVIDLGGTPPEATVCRPHLGRLWMNDKENPDRLHYSSTYDETEWGGTGDSGAIDIGIGDGDPSGITAIFPTFKGELFVAKNTKLYRVSGYSPETFIVTLVSSGIGCTSHNSVAAVDQDDVIFQSKKGFHSLVATQNYGDFEGKYLSKDIQKTFNNNFTANRLPYSWGVYVPTLSSYAVAITDSDYSSTANLAIWLYNIQQQAWYLWPNVDCEAMFLVNNSDLQRPYLASSTRRLGKTLDGTTNDTDTSGTSVSIDIELQTGFIYPDNSPYTIKGFKNISLFYKPTESHQLTVEFQIDNYDAQSDTITVESGSDVLGSTFILGTSILDTSFVPEPRILSIDGYGRGFQLTLRLENTDQDIEIDGFIVEYELAGTSRELS